MFYIIFYYIERFTLELLIVFTNINKQLPNLETTFEVI